MEQPSRNGENARNADLSSEENMSGNEAFEDHASSNAARGRRNSHRRSRPRLQLRGIPPTRDCSDFSDEEFEGFGGQDDPHVGWARFAEILVFLESGDFFDSDLGSGRGREREDSLSLSDDGELPDDPLEREMIGSLPEPTMSLHRAAMRGNAKELRRWQNWKTLGHGRVTWRHRRDLPLHCAARAGDVSTVEQLLEEGAKIKQRNHREHTALLIAARNGHAAVVKTLLDHGACTEPRELDEVFKVSKTWAVVKVLADFYIANDDLNAALGEEDDQPPWIYQMLFRVVQKGLVTMLKGLLRIGANANSAGILGWTPLQIACRRGHIRCASELLKHGADVASRDDFRWTALHYAAREGQYDIVEMLLKAGADATAMCRTGITPMEVAPDEATRQLLKSHKRWKRA